MANRIYQWDRWFRQPAFRLRRGKHYLCGQASMAQQVRNAAYQRGVSVSIEETPSGIDVRVTARGWKQLVNASRQG